LTRCRSASAAFLRGSAATSARCTHVLSVYAVQPIVLMIDWISCKCS
jgi:hypothetical protein